MMSSHPHGSSGLRARQRLPRLALVRRLAAGVPPHRAAEGTGLEPAAVEALLAERGFRRAVDAYRDLLSRPPEARLQRLYELALQVLEQALAEGCRLTLFYMLRESAKGRDPVATLVARIDRRLNEAPPSAQDAPPATPEKPEPAPAEAATAAAEAALKPKRRPEPEDAQAWRTAARLRREILDEAGLAAAAVTPAPAARPADETEPKDDLDLIDPVTDPLGAAVHQLHRDADRRHAEQRRAAQAAASRPPPATSPPPDRPVPDPPPDEPPRGAAASCAPASGAPPPGELGPDFAAAFHEEFVQLPPEIQAKLATFSAEDMDRLFTDLTRRELARMQHEAEAAARPRDGP